jgi:nicotinamidase-related amidase
MIDCQQTYREGVMKLEDVEAALKEAAALLRRFRKAGRPVIHIMHDAGSGSPYDINAPIGQIADDVAPIAGETVIVKKFPSAFEQTDLDAELKKHGVENVVYVGFMTHMCVNSTTRASFNHGFANTVVAGATATRRDWEAKTHEHYGVLGYWGTGWDIAAGGDDLMNLLRSMCCLFGGRCAEQEPKPATDKAEGEAPGDLGQRDAESEKADKDRLRNMGGRSNLGPPEDRT